MEANKINALDDAACHLARQIAFCGASAERCLGIAWAQHTHLDDKHHYFRQMESFMRVSVELAGALAKLKGDANTHRQHISVERIERLVSQPAQTDAPASNPMLEDAIGDAVARAPSDEEHATETVELPQAAKATADAVVKPADPLEVERLRRREWIATTLAQNRAGIAARERRESEARVARIMADAVPTEEDYAEADADWAARHPATEPQGEGGGVGS